MPINNAASVDSALSYLESVQLASGQFPMEFTVRDHDGRVAGQSGTHPEKSPFCTAYIAGSLAWCDDERARRMVTKAAAFLEREKVRSGLWRYWSKDAPLHSQIPPDVDDTACISELLRRVTGRCPDNAHLLVANRSRDGLFYTWIIPRVSAPFDPEWWWIVLTDMTWGRVSTFWNAGAKRDDIDSVVNANVVLYLGNRAETADAIRWLNAIARDGKEQSSDKWYRSSAAFYYAVSRCHAAGMEGMTGFEKPLQRCLASTEMQEANDLQLAMMLCALQNFGRHAGEQRRIAEGLISSQSGDGGWASFPIYFDGRADPLISWGSRAVTTGFCVEALARMPELKR